MYNWSYHIQQCFNYQNYGHGTLQCVKPIACHYWGKKHQLIECKGKTTTKCPICGGNHHTYDQVYKERKTEIKHIKATSLLTAEKYPVINLPLLFLVLYFSSLHAPAIHKINSTFLPNTKPQTSKSISKPKL